MNVKTDLNLRSEFDYFKSNNGVYLDSAATALKPRCVVEAISEYYTNYTSNVHRSGSNRATYEYESARAKIGNYIGAISPIFTPGTTASLNMIARFKLFEGKDVIISDSEHHSNIVPWTMNKHRIYTFETSIRDTFYMQGFEDVVRKHPTSIVSFAQINNVTGIELPVKEMCEIAHKYGCITVIDGCQAVTHKKINVKDLGADFYVFSGHKLFGPTGIGVMAINDLNIAYKLEPVDGGGGMVGSVVNENGFTTAEYPYNLEAGTPNIAGAIGLGAAINWIESVTMERIEKNNNELYAYASPKIEDVYRIGKPSTSNIISFKSTLTQNMSGSDIDTLLRARNIFIRIGSQCSKMLLSRFRINEAYRLSFGPHNTTEDIDIFFDEYYKILKL
jgi:selenocysteine lyase/cysteine desulfurase